MLNKIKEATKSVTISLSIIAAASLLGALFITVYLDWQQCLATAPAELVHMCSM